ncbi:MAG: CoA pyrophosphatase [Myxococcales bacterium]|nr:CoA pyrophosphatase [Myxococcales bacterium]
MLQLHPDALGRRLTGRQPRVISKVLAPRRAAVATIVRIGQVGPEVLLMQRVQRDTDRWSGHVSFPGGMADPVDGDLVDTAMRETHEEVGLRLVRTALVGRSDDQVAIARGKALPMAITPYVFRLQGERPELTLGPEAASAFWLPLRAVVSGELDGVYVWSKGPLRKELPCWHYEGFTVWGLTHQMLSKLIEFATSG